MSKRRTEFDPYALLQALEQHRVNYVLVGGFARVIHGSPETTDGVDITPQTRADNLVRLSRALDDLNARRSDRKPLELGDALPAEPLVLNTSGGELKLVAQPTGTRNGYHDLRRHATRENLGQGVKPRVASLPDLARTLTALDRPGADATLRHLHALIEHERGRALGR